MKLRFAQTELDCSLGFNSEIFRNFVDAFPRGALLAHHFGSVDRLEPAKALKCLKNCGIMKAIYLAG